MKNYVVNEARNEDDKRRAVSDYQQHLETARLKRDEYRQQCAAAHEELEQHELARVVASPDSPYSPPLPASQQLINMHYTFDFCQPVNLPHHTQQVGPLFFYAV